MQKRSKEKLILNSPFSIFNSKAAFTLAEVLITLTVLGVIAAITIPNVIHKVQDRITVTKLKKAFATFSTAYDVMVAEKGDPSKFDYSGTTASGSYLNVYRSSIIAKNLAPYLNGKLVLNNQLYYNPDFFDNIGSGHTHVAFNCRNKNNTSCREGSYNAPGILMKNGVYYGIKESFNYNTNQTVTQDGGKIKVTKKLGLLIDLNGKKGPNAIGEDAFMFLVTDKGLDPGFKSSQGVTYDNELGSFYVLYNCNRARTTGSFRGYSCGNYIMRHGNMNYKYKDYNNNSTESKAEFYGS